MSLFTIRVQLNNTGCLDEAASRALYSSLALQLSVWGITDVIRSDSGRWYKMLNGDYSYEGYLSVDDVHANALVAARVVWSDVAVFVTEGQARRWHGLDEVPAPVPYRPSQSLNALLRLSAVDSNPNSGLLRNFSF